MPSVSGIVSSVQLLLGQWAVEVNKEHRVVQRERKFSVSTLVSTLVLGMLQKSHASARELATMAMLRGVEISPQGMDQRFTAQLADFLEHLFRRATQSAVGMASKGIEVLDRFSSVVLLDSSTVSLPDDMQREFPGCGGSHGGGQSALKLQTQWDLKTGALVTVALETGRQCDYKTPVQRTPLPPNSLRISDLGYFDICVFKAIGLAGNYWLSRLQYATNVYRSGQKVPLMLWLSKQAETFIDIQVEMGSEQRLPCRLIACRVPEAMANRRRSKLIAETKSKRGAVPTEERLAWCDWTILVTNCPEKLLAVREAFVLYGARWQIELLFKRWKSLGLIAEMTGADTTEKRIRMWSRLLGVLLEHWLMLSTSWTNARTSLAKAQQIIRDYIELIARDITHPRLLLKTLKTIKKMIEKTAQYDKRKRKNTNELLEDPRLLQYGLT